MQAYSNPTRIAEPTSLPDLEIFFIVEDDGDFVDDEGMFPESGFYYWFCSPGCLPDSDPVGPFTSEEEALDDARSWNDDVEDDA